MAAQPTTVPPVSSLPISTQRYVLTGREPSPIVRDLVTVGNQVPRWAYALAAGFSLWKAYKAYEEWKKKKPGAAPA